MTKPKDPQEPVFEDPLKVGEWHLSYDTRLPELEMLRKFLAEAEQLPMTKKIIDEFKLPRTRLNKQRLVMNSMPG